ncbi:hypothetical protein CDD83_7155 [Cordyceps sp. RAO-2017]|nr:hypothetical protein CDD83_7155 [Cordyceps sp. RAO-2017]
MASKTEPSSSRLCVFCRRLEQAGQPCPSLGAGRPSSGPAPISLGDSTASFSAQDAALFQMLHKQPSSLCPRCSDYDIVGAFRDSELWDSSLLLPPGPHGLEKDKINDRARRFAQLAQFELPLGPLSSLHLTPSCQFCRLIYRIIPQGELDPDDWKSTLQPFRSVVRQSGWNTVSPYLRNQSAIMLGFGREHRLFKNVSSVPVLAAHETTVHESQMTGEAIALESSQASPGRTLFHPQYVDALVDFAAIRRAVELCEASHPTCARGGWPAEMSTVRVVDVVNRRVVACPDACDYLALSYVWGKVRPADGALESRTLPRTIEDAMTVDALCIDQGSSLTAEQMAAKQEQLNMMDLIYDCATLTIVAVAGNDSTHGLPGVSSGRNHQVRESIAGYELFTTPPTFEVERTLSVWGSRAWTLQEYRVSRRLLSFTANQVVFDCWTSTWEESIRAESLKPPAPWPETETRVLSSDDEQLRNGEVTQAIFGRSPSKTVQLNEKFPLLLYHCYVYDYTRRSMSDPNDSLNAFLGMLALMRRHLFPSGFVWGLPLRSHPQTLGWTHGRECLPKRLAGFPSWSWAGWQGGVFWPDSILDQSSSRGWQNPRNDLTVRLVSAAGAAIAVEGWLVDLEVRTEPLSEAFKPCGDDLIGIVREGDFLHNNTLPTGTYSFLVVQRLTYNLIERGRDKQEVCLLLLDWHGEYATRKSIVTIRPLIGDDFMRAEPERKTIWLR